MRGFLPYTQGKYKLIIETTGSSVLTLNEDNIIGVGHSIGGNLILRAALNQPEKFKKIILLDPTMLVPIKTFFWNIMCIFNLQSKFLPLINKAKNKKMVFNDLNEVFDSYRNKTMFSNFKKSL